MKDADVDADVTVDADAAEIADVAYSVAEVAVYGLY